MPGPHAVVIGSGYGGSVAALRLTKMGYSVTVLERGSEFRPGDFPNDISELPKFIRAPSADGRRVTGRANGLFEWRLGPGVVSLVGNGLGGGSLINAGVVMRPDPDVFAQESWPARIRLSTAFASEPDKREPGLEKWFHRAEEALGSKPWLTTHIKSKAFNRVANSLRFPTEKDRAAHTHKVLLTIDEKKCTHCGNCATGCNDAGAKKTLRDTYLAEASKRGATMICGASVWTITPVRSAATESGGGHAPADHWRLRVLDTTAIGRWPRWEDAAHLEAEGFDFETELVVLAAGTFGSTELLQRSRDRCGDRWWLSPELGNRFSANGDSLDFFVDNKAPVYAIGVGANSWQQRKEGEVGVGPTITRQIDLRDSGGDRPIPLRSRLTIEDAAVPGAIAGLFSEMLATGLTAARLDNWRTGPPHTGWKRFFNTGDISLQGRDPLAAGDALSRHSHIVLTMGHDESKGRIVWVPGRDASVPYWENPEKLETYRVQKEVFTDTADRLAAEWVPNPAWRLLPESAAQVMSGPAPATSITTVHPLGGCIMGDDPTRSVVDDVGRLWRSDRGNESEEDWKCHENFLVLDGSIVPTALGVNPLLTITALAERAMDALQERTANDGLAGCGAKPIITQPDSSKEDPRTGWQRAKPQQWSVTMRERLVCESLQLRGDMAIAFGKSSAGGELDLELVVNDWLRMWESANHPIDSVNGTLRLQVGNEKNPLVATYRVKHTDRCEILAVSEYGPGCWRCLRWVWKIGPWLRTALTYLIMRPDILDNARSPKPGQRETWLEIWTRRALPGLRQFGHSAERRTMHYHLQLELYPGDEKSRHLDQKWTHRWYNNLPDPSRLPRNIELIGTKRVEYPATWRELWRWIGDRFPCGQRVVAPLRESFFDQASHLSVEVPAGPGSEPRLAGRFLMDFSALLRDPPLLLGPAGDLTGGLAALGAYPGVFLRFLLKTRLPDFRLPNYSQTPMPDVAARDELMLRPPPPEEAPAVQRHVLRVERGASSGDGIEVNAEAKFELVLWRYARPSMNGRSANKEAGLPDLANGNWYGKSVQRLKSVLLVHAYAQSGYTYTLNTLPVNLAGLLYQEGYEVWVLEHRLSTRLPIHEEPSTLDQIAKIDLPRAVDYVLGTLKSEFGKQQPEQCLTLPQVHVFAQCLGSAALGMSLLSGQLHYVDVLTEEDLDEPTPCCPKLASIIFSQTHAMCIGQPGTQARTWIPAFIGNAFGRTNIPMGVRGPVDSLAEAWMDRVFAGLPIPQGEHCPDAHSAGEDDCATCRRVRFIEAPLFKHANLNLKTHRQLPLHFGKANIRTFAQSAKCVEAERLVDEDGQSVYVNNENARKFGALPLAFLHGAENELFHPESAIRTAMFFARLHPDWAILAARALGSLAQSADCAAWLVPRHGHYDVLIGQEAPTLVYPGIASFFNFVQGIPAQGDRHQARGQPQATLHIPRVGPIIGPLAYNAEHGKIQIPISFMIDDRFSDGIQDSSGQPGTRSWAYARIRSGSDPNVYCSTHSLDIRRRRASARQLGDPDPYRTKKDDATAYRFAVGTIEVNPANWKPGTPLDIEAFSVHESLAVEPGDYSEPLHGSLQSVTRSQQSCSQAKPEDGAIDEWLERLLYKSAKHLEALAGKRLPLPETPSRMRLEAERADFLYARVSAAARTALLPKKGTSEADSVSFLASTCRYPGFPFDRHRAEYAVQRVLPRLGDKNPAHHPAFGLFVGDQIYADATAGIVDPLSPTERFAERHRSALSRSADYHRAALGDLLANLPVVMTPDDHEYIDNYPAGPPLAYARTRERLKEVQTVAWHAATDAWRFFQSSSGGVGSRGWLSFEAGPLRVLVLDSRSHRDIVNGRIFSDEQRSQIAAWLNHKDAQHHLNMIVTGSVVMPGLRRDADPANPGQPDTFQCAPLERNWLLEKLAQCCTANPDSFRFALLSGDYHVSLVSRLKLGNNIVGLSLIVPPVYAPMPYMNATPDSIDFSEHITVNLADDTSATWSVEALDMAVTTPVAAKSVMTGSAIAEIRVSRATAAGTPPYKIQWRADLVDYEQGGPGYRAYVSTDI